MKQIKLPGIGVKMLFIGVVFCLLLIGLSCIRRQLSKREYSSNFAKSEITSSAGGEFSVDGPYLEIPVVHVWYSERTVDGKLTRDKHEETQTITLSADSIRSHADLSSEVRHIGIYSAPVYTGTLTMDATFDIRLEESDGLTLQLDKARLYFDARKKTLKSHPSIIINGAAYSADVLATGSREYIGTECAVQRGLNEIHADIQFRGAGRFSLSPSAKENTLTVTADWASPGFTGFDYLPDTHTISGNGFSAEWNVPFSNSNAAVGFSYIQPVDVYKQLSRALTYGFLFIIVPFIVMFLFELFAKVSLHPMHYLLCGAASVIFFLLLLALSEHIPFVAAYLAGAVAAGVLVSLYLASVTHSARVGAGMAVTFALLYAYLYFSLKSEDYAFLIGAIFAFIMLALVMFCTRNVDWAAFGHRKALTEPADNRQDLTRKTSGTPSTSKESARGDDPWGVTT